MNCPYCEISFSPKRKTQKFCSVSCASRFNLRKIAAKGTRRLLTCEHCGIEELVNNSDKRHRFCSRKCYKIGAKKELQEHAKRIFSQYAEARKQAYRRYVASPQYVNSMAGKTLSDAQRLYRSEVLKKYWSDRVHHNKGMLVSNLTRAKQSKAQALRYVHGKHTTAINNFYGIKRGWLTLQKTRKPVWYRSSWERKHFLTLDSDPNVSEIYVEALRIPYFFEYERNYIPDVLVFFKDGRIECHEIKPKAYVSYPINLAKFEAAEKYCAQEAIHFRVLSDFAA